MIVKTDAIVLNSFKYGETSKIVTLYTKDSGKIKVIAKGSRKPKNKFGSSLDPLSYIQICYYHKQSTELFLLSDASHLIPLRKIQDSYLHLSAGLIMAEAINVTQHINETNQDLWELSVQAFTELNALPLNPFSLSIFFLIKLAEIIGFALDLNTFPVRNHDMTEERRIISSDNIFFSIESGIFSVPSNKKKFFSFSKQTANDLYYLANSSLKTAGDKDLSKEAIIQLHDFFNVYFSYHLDRKNSFKTINLFKQFYNI